ncbi:hypothetical protein [Flavobacterium sp. HBTb2-11-1]|uniref:hypothetical protein n=1 Tax=Flavobacterium sp. HBTb2-11-1 TaxID=2692212 RepID=UPI00136E34CD|nr:hypothetical protein [Flavobacterium sp. HBTb2-11-1]MXO07269.1 hypothetical protein [Flavobacterium sp. HBTb2-11-1]
MKFSPILFFLFICLPNYSFSCECMPIDRENMIEKGLKQSEIVFYGEVIKVDSIKRTFTFRIIELFKGKYNSQYIKGKEFTSCSILPIQKQLWIIYADFKKGKIIIDISGCSPSMGFKPYQNYSFPPPPPKDHLLISKDEKVNLLSNYVWELKYENQNIQDWIYHLEKLRAYKTFENQNLEKEKQSKIESYSQYIIISLIVNIVLFLILLFVILKKKNFSK